MRDAASTSDQSQKQQNRARVAPKMSAGADVDYRTLHDAFFKHQNKPDSMTEFGDLYYEGKEFETGSGLKIQPGVLSTRLRDALGMTETSPTPWLINMQRYGPPPSYPNLTIPGLNAPIPAGCSYGYHHGGWGKPPVDPFGRPLYGGNPFTAAAETGAGLDNASDRNITSDGKTITKKPWGALPTATDYDEESSSSEDEDESSGEEMEEESDDEEEQIEEENEVQEPSVPPEGAESVGPGSAFDLRKTNTGDETPQQPKQLYQVLEQTSANKAQQAGAVFQSDVKYVLPEEGAESVLSKAMPGDATTSVASKRKRRDEDDEDDDTDLTKKFKF
jgi:splicing factor 3B subunit 2